MKCPVDGETLVMTARSGVEIDYCPRCRGVWLDRGELDKIIERASPPVVMPEPGRAERDPYIDGPEPARAGRVHRDERHDRRAGRHEGERRRKKRGNFLSEIFDFDLDFD